MTQMLASNQYFMGTVWLLILGGVAGSLYVLSLKILDLFLRMFVTTVTLKNDNEAFEWLMRYLGHIQEKDSNQLTSESILQRIVQTISKFSSSSTTAHSNTFALKLTNKKRKNFFSNAHEEEGNIEFLPGPGNHIFKYKGKLVWLHRHTSGQASVRGWEQQPYVEETLKLTCYGRNKNFFRDLFVDAKKACEIKDRNVTKVYSLSEWRSDWVVATTKQPRSFESVMLEGDISQRLLSDVTEFINSQDFYVERGLPYRRGYLLYGPPGCGKTSFVLALAAKLKFDICALTLSGDDLDDKKLTACLRKCPARSLILLEDIDCMFVDREITLDHRDSGNRITFSGLLNAIDGVASQEGRVMFMTTNHLDKLDAALQRPGRCDVKIEFKLASRSQLFSMFCNFFPNVSSIVDYATKFSSCVPEDSVAMASVQEYLIRHQQQHENDQDAAVAAANGADELLLTMNNHHTSDNQKETMLIAEWLRRLGIPQYTDDFHQQSVFMLSDLCSDDTLKSNCLKNIFGVKTFGHQELIMAMIDGRKDVVDDFEYVTESALSKLLLSAYACDPTHDVEQLIDALAESKISAHQVKNHVGRYKNAGVALLHVQELLDPSTHQYKMDTRTWLKSLGMEQYVDGFLNNEIVDQDDIVELGEQDLKEYGVETKVHLAKMLRGIKKLKK
ncbi:mitochondrial chaperone bcs1 [Acrasis kona]|uniref:Mitochondrial chaperone bcs1 n=1 Tax=Acrasis kona TaxID=1008807 RepID=A0AAW2Z8R4_9EUKA